MPQLGLMIDMNKCIGCKTCVVACRNYHGIVDHENCMPGKIPFYLRVESFTSGTYPKITQQSWVVPCQHCKNAECIKACASGAISKDLQNGIVRIDPDKCTGSKACIEACPYGVIQFDTVRNKAHKCDLCYDRVVAGEQPVCVEACMTDAITFGEKERLLQKARDMGREIDKKKSAMSIIYLKPLPKNTLAQV